MNRRNPSSHVISEFSCVISEVPCGTTAAAVALLCSPSGAAQQLHKHFSEYFSRLS